LLLNAPLLVLLLLLLQDALALRLIQLLLLGLDRTLLDLLLLLLLQPLALLLLQHTLPLRVRASGALRSGLQASRLYDARLSARLWPTGLYYTRLNARL